MQREDKKKKRGAISGRVERKERKKGQKRKTCRRKGD